MSNSDSTSGATVEQRAEDKWIGFKIIDQESGDPVRAVHVTIKGSDGKPITIDTLDNGEVRFNTIETDTCDLTQCSKGHAFLEEDREYTLNDGDSLKCLAESELANGNDITWDDIAAFNWGEESRDETIANEHMRDELGCTDYDGTQSQRVYTSGDTSHTILIPKKIRRTSLAINTKHEIKANPKATPPQFLSCCAIPNINFEASNSFIQPNAEKYLATLKEQVSKHPDAKLMIFGHTDQRGDETANKLLSERRGKSAFSLITKNPEYWVTLYKYGQKNPENEDWGAKSVQSILNFLNPDAHLDLSNYLDDRTIKEIETIVKPAWEQTSFGKRIPDSSLKKIFQTYFDKLMEGSDIKDSDFVDLKHAGCSALNPIIDIDLAEEENRRVTFFLFDKERLPKFPCSNTDLAPCKTQSAQFNQDKTTFRNNKIFTCAFYDSIARDCDVETEFPDIIAIDGHMHFMTGHCTPLPLLWGQFPVRVVPRSDLEFFRKGIYKVVNPRSRLDKVGRNLKWVFAEGTSRLAGTSAKKTEKIAAMGFDQNKAIFDRLYARTMAKKPSVKLLTPMVAMPMDMSFSHIDGYTGKAIYTKVISRNYYCKVSYIKDSKGRVTNTVYTKYLKWPKEVTDVIKDAGDDWYDLSSDELTDDHIRNAEMNIGISDPDKMHVLPEKKGNSKQIKDGFYYYLDRKNINEIIHSIKDKAPHWLHWEEMDLFVDWDAQRDDTIAAALNYPFQYLPMYHYDPRRWCNDTGHKEYAFPKMKKDPIYPWGWDIPFNDIATTQKPGVFIGFKMYTALGYRPSDYAAWDTASKPRLPNMKMFYERCEKEGIPIMSHCSPGGVYSHDRELYFDLAVRLEQMPYDRWIISDRKKDWYYDHFVRPEAWEPVLIKFPKLKLCLAHFGGDIWKDWHSHVGSTISSRSKNKDPYDSSLLTPQEKRKKEAQLEKDAIKKIYETKEYDKFSWIRQIVDLMEKKTNGVYNYPNFYTDISYHFMKEHHREFLWLIINHPIVKERVLFGTDWYMTENDKKSVEAFVLDAKTDIDIMSQDYFEQTGIYEDLWLTFSRINPMKFYGIRSVADNYAAGLQARVSPPDRINVIPKIDNNLKIIKESDL